MSSFDVLIADDEKDLRTAIHSLLSQRGFHVEEAEDGERALDMIQNKTYDLVLLDVRMPKLDGLEVLKRTRNLRPSTTVAIITAQANLKDAVQAIHDGAFDYIEKPLKEERLNALVDRALEARKLVEQIAMSRPSEASTDKVERNPKQDFVGHSAPMQRIFRMIDKLANVNTSVLIRGENGTGKEMVAKAIHFNSPRKHRPFIAVNCGAVPEAQLEAEFFGQEKGAMGTDSQRQIGKFQLASGGTLFLDEVTDLPLNVQVKLLKTLQEQKMTPVGSNREVKVDVRVIAATHRDIEALMQEAKFRNDLFYRLNVMPVFLPSLKERTEDLPKLIEHFIESFNSKHQRKVTGVDPRAMEKLQKYDWPGNIRELQNAIEHAFVIETSSLLQLESFPDPIVEGIMDKEEGWALPLPQNKAGAPLVAELKFSLNYHEDKENFEKEFIIQALKSNQGKINQTCEKANIPKNTLLRKIKKYGITPKDYE